MKKKKIRKTYPFVNTSEENMKLHWISERIFTVWYSFYFIQFVQFNFQDNFNQNGKQY